MPILTRRLRACANSPLLPPLSVLKQRKDPPPPEGLVDLDPFGLTRWTVSPPPTSWTVESFPETSLAENGPNAAPSMGVG